MIELKALVFFAAVLAVYLLRKLRKASEPEPEPDSFSINSNTKMLIEELHILNRQHTQLLQLLFDLEQEQEQKKTYSINYQVADGHTKTADIMYTEESKPHIQHMALQQIETLENRIKGIIDELQQGTRESLHVDERNISGTLQNISRTTEYFYSGENLKKLLEEMGECYD